MQRIYLERTSGIGLSMEDMERFSASAGGDSGASEEANYQVVNGVAILDIIGPISQYMSWFTYICGGCSTDWLAYDFKQALADPNVSSIILRTNSPGGAVHGTPDVANLIYNSRDIKPVYAFCEGMMCSAAWWIGSAASQVYLSGPTNEVGSIGVIAKHVDRSQADKAAGLDVKVMTAGKYKGVGHPHGPLSAEHENILQAELDTLYTTFIDATAQYRGVDAQAVIDTMGEGRIFIGQQAIDVGLADGMMSLDDLIQLAAEKGAMNLAVTTAMGGRASAESHTEERTMTREEFQANHAALFAEITSEARQAGATEAVTGERARLAAVLEVPAPGHQALVFAALVDGTTAEQLSLQILQAEKSQRDAHLKNTQEGKNAAVPETEAPDKGTEENRALIAAAVNGGSVQ
jgi:signal peptide peptidase SppA